KQHSHVRERWIREAGAGLSALHKGGHGGVRYAHSPLRDDVEGSRRTLHDDLQELHEYIAPMEQVNPDLAGRFTEAIGEIERFRSPVHCQEEPPVASHGAFRTDRLMIEDDHLVIIDLDSFCWANPACDVGNFLAYLDWKEI